MTDGAHQEKAIAAADRMSTALEGVRGDLSHLKKASRRHKIWIIITIISLVLDLALTAYIRYDQNRINHFAHALRQNQVTQYQQCLVGNNNRAIIDGVLVGVLKQSKTILISRKHLVPPGQESVYNQEIQFYDTQINVINTALRKQHCTNHS